MDAAVDRLMGRLGGSKVELGYEVPQGNGVAPVPAIVGVTAHEPVNEERIFQRAVEDFEAKRAKEERKQNQVIEFGCGPIALCFGGDEHFGGAGTDVARCFREAKIVNDTPGMYHARMGDMVNQFILGRMRAIRDGARISIPDEWVLAKMLVRLMKPKLVALVGGNHDLWAEKASGMDRLKEIMPHGPLYDKHQIEFTIRVGTAERVIKMRHKWRGHSIFNPTHGIEVTARRDMAHFDVGVGAHTHIAGLVREFVAQRERKLAVITNTYKKYDEYGVECGFPQTDDSTCSVVVFEESGEMFGAPSMEWAANYLKMHYQGQRLAA